MPLIMSGIRPDHAFPTSSVAVWPATLLLLRGILGLGTLDIHSEVGIHHQRRRDRRCITKITPSHDDGTLPKTVWTPRMVNTVDNVYVEPRKVL